MSIRFPHSSKHSAIVASHIKNSILGNPSIPRKILTDHGLEFTDLQGMCRELNITHVKSPTFYPQASGAVESGAVKITSFHLKYQIGTDDYHASFMVLTAQSMQSPEFPHLSSRTEGRGKRLTMGFNINHNHE